MLRKIKQIRRDYLLKKRVTNNVTRYVLSDQIVTSSTEVISVKDKLSKLLKSLVSKLTKKR